MSEKKFTPQEEAWFKKGEKSSEKKKGSAPKESAPAKMTEGQWFAQNPAVKNKIGTKIVAEKMPEKMDEDMDQAA